jgi:hypothetical protein
MWRRKLFGKRELPPELGEALVDVARALWVVGIGLLLLATLKSQLAQGTTELLGAPSRAASVQTAE